MKTISVVIHALLLATLALGSTYALAADGAGSSDFERFLHAQKGVMPTEYASLLVELRDFLDPGKAPVGSAGFLEVPDSRSLQRDNSTLVEPRRIAQVQADGGKGPPTFVSYAPNSKGLEVISWNQTERRYEFMVVRDYGAGLRPRLAREPHDGNRCIGCHQGEGPIFSRFPWLELSTNARNGALRERIDAERRVARLKPIHKKGVEFEDSPFGFDATVRQANRFLQANRVCSDLCGTDATCHRWLLLLTIFGDPDDNGSFSRAFLTDFDNAVRPHWPAGGFSHPSSVLPDRNPRIAPLEGGASTTFQPKDLESFRVSLRGLSRSDAPNLTYAENFSSADIRETNLQENIHFGLGDGSPGNPQTPRPLVSGVELPATLFQDGAGDPLFAADTEGFITAIRQLAQAMGTCFGLTAEDRTTLSTFARERVRDVVLNDGTLSEVISSWPPSRANLMAALTQALVRDAKTLQKLKDCPHPTAETLPAAPVKQLVGVKEALEKQALPSVPGEIRSRALLTKYCAQCHAGDQAIVRLPIDDFSKMRSYRTKRGFSVVNRLSGTTTSKMPPPTAKAQPTESERLELIGDLGGF